jgi:uncharacterized protein (TIRG00374 family)
MISTALIGAVVANVSFEAAWQKVGRLSGILLCSVILILALQTVLAAFRWSLILRHQRVNLGFVAVLRITLIGVFFNQLLPSSIGGDAIRAWCIYRNGYRRGTSIIAVVTDRFFGMAGLVILGIMTFPMIGRVEASRETTLVIGAIIGAAATALVVACWLDKLPSLLRRSKIVQGLGAFSVAARGLTRSLCSVLPVITLSVAIQGLTALAIVLTIGGIEASVDLLACAAIIPTIVIVSMLPVSIAGWGVREGVMVFGMGLVGVPSETALIASMIFGLALALIGLVGGLVWLSGVRR